jgi:hypothetical protein
VLGSRAGCGEGEDAPDEGEERERLRRQARAWLRAHLAGLARELDRGGAQAAAWVQQGTVNWQRSPDLAGLRDPPLLARLPEEEQAACRRLWADVRALQQRAGGKAGKR